MTEKKTDEYLGENQDTILEGDPADLHDLINEAVEAGVVPTRILDAATAAMDRAGERWDRLETYLPDVVRIAHTMQEGLHSLHPHLEKTGGLAFAEPKKIVLGRVSAETSIFSVDVLSSQVSLARDVDIQHADDVTGDDA